MGLIEAFHVQTAAGRWLRSQSLAVSVTISSIVVCASLVLAQQVADIVTDRMTHLHDVLERLPWKIVFVLVCGVTGTAALRAFVFVVEKRVDALALERELEIASQLQSEVLPGLERLRALPPSVEVIAVLEQAGTLGGDFYDAFMLDEQRLCFAVGDVVGKGVPAALFMLTAKSVMKSAVLRHGPDLHSAAQAANHEISQHYKSGLRVSVVFGIIELTTGRVELCNAGHENPYVIPADQSVSERKLEGGLAFGVSDNFPYPVEDLKLDIGDILLMVTDGVPEAKSPDGQLFGRKRTIVDLCNAPASLTPTTAVERIVSSVKAFAAGGDPQDDLTVMAIAYRGPTMPEPTL